MSTGVDMKASTCERVGLRVNILEASEGGIPLEPLSDCCSAVRAQVVVGAAAECGCRKRACHGAMNKAAGAEGALEGRE